MKPAESFIQQPIRSLQTMLRVLAEDDPKLPTVTPDGIYGPSTLQAVAAFQRQNALISTGITDQQTWEAVVTAYDEAIIRVDQAESIQVILDPGEVFRLDDSSPYIYLLQGMLMFLSTRHSAIQAPGTSGIIDANTSLSISSFQNLAGLPVTGELDKITWKHLANHFTVNAHDATVKQHNKRSI